MTKSQTEMFRKLLDLKVTAAKVLADAQVLADKHNEPLSWGIGEVYASGQYSSNVHYAVQALEFELRGAVRHLLPAVQGHPLGNDQ